MKTSIIKSERRADLENTNDNKANALAAAREFAMTAINSEAFDNDEGSTNLYVIDNILRPIGYFKERLVRKIEVDDIIPVWQLFIDLCREINKKKPFAPTIFTFCNFMNISSATFNAIRQENTARGELCQYISDSLSDRLMQLLLENKIPTIPGIFVAKANFGMRDNDQPVTNVIINDGPSSFEEIMEMYKKG